jgi:hypothetical protein
LTVFLVFLVVILVSFTGGDGEETRSVPRNPGGKGTSSEGKGDNLSKIDEEMERGEKALEEAKAFRTAHPERYDEAIAKFRGVIREFGQSWAEICLREIDAIKQARREAVAQAWEALKASVEKAALVGRFREARAELEAFLEEKREAFGSTREFGKAKSLLTDLNERITRAVHRFEEDARRAMTDGDFDGARAFADRILRIDPKGHARKVRDLRRDIEKAEREAREVEEERKGRDLLEKARQKASSLVRAWKPREAIEPFEAVRAESKSRAIWDLAARELDDLDRLARFFKAAGEAQGAVGRELVIGGEKGRVEKVSGGFIHLKLGRVVRGFRLRELTVEDFARFCNLSLPDGDKDVKRGFAAYLLYMGKTERAAAALATLDLGDEDKAFYRDKMGK